MTIKKFTIALALCVLPAPSLAAETKYKRGDCITATDPDYTWHSEVATVKGVGNIDGNRGGSYMQWFPTYKSNDIIFELDVEKHTEKAPEELCKRRLGQ
jgi:hypothetical protein